MEILGYALSVLMGFTLGLLGGGGSILTVPILVYVLGIDPVLGTAYSLFVVGSTAVIGGWRKHLQDLVEWKTGLIFAIPSLLAVFGTRYYLVPVIPQYLFSIGDFSFTKDIGIMIFFGIVMLLASYSMIQSRRESYTSPIERPFRPFFIVLEGLIVGIVTGLVGAGGGFLIVPTLVLLLGLPIKKAIGTSLVIIAVKSLIGFLGDIGSGQHIDWPFLLIFTAFSIAGMFAGIYATRFIDSTRLRKGFGWFVLVMGVFIIFSEIFL